MKKRCKDQKATSQVKCSASEQTTKITNTTLHNKTVGLSGLPGVTNIEPTEREIVELQAQVGLTTDRVMAKVDEMKVGSESRDMIVFRDINALADRSRRIEERMKIIEEMCGKEKYVDITFNQKMDNSIGQKTDKIVKDLTFNNVILVNELDILRDRFALMERRMQTIEGYNTEMTTNQNEKYKHLVDKLDVFTENISKAPTISNNSDSQAVYVKELNYKIDKLQKTINTIMCENKSLVQSNINMVKKINTLESKLAKIQRIGRKIFVHKNNFKSLNDDFNKFKHLKNDFDVKSRLQAIEKTVYNEKPEKLTRQYKNLKMRLCVIERDIKTNSHQSLQNMIMMSNANLIGVNRVNRNSMTNVPYQGRHQQDLSIPPALPLSPQDMSQKIKETTVVDDIIADKKITKTVDQEEALLSPTNLNETISTYIPPPPPPPPPRS